MRIQSMLIAAILMGCGIKEEESDIVELIDADGDGSFENEDCDDNDASKYPGADEVCDGIDNDCDGDTDNGAIDTLEFYIDTDGDGFGDSETSIDECEAPPGFVLDNTDCDDSDVDINPDAEEICDEGIDNDCDGLVDGDDPDVSLSMWYQDVDGDGFGDEDDPGYEVCTPPPGFVLDNTDCDDSDVDTNPSGSVNESDPTQCMTDVDGDGYGDTEPTNTNATPGTDCDDNDASNIPADTDGDGYSGCSGDCDDTDASINPDATETLLDGADNDCDGTVDNLSAEDYSSAVTGAAQDYLSFDNGISAGDLNGDGINDLMVGGSLLGSATDSNNDGYYDEYVGGVYMLNGADYSTWDGNAVDYQDAHIAGTGLLNYYGLMSSSQSDMDGDGTVDLTIGGTDGAGEYIQDGYSEVAASIFLEAAALSGEYLANDADFVFTTDMGSFYNPNQSIGPNYGSADVSTNYDLNWYNQGNACNYGACGSIIYLYSGSDLAASGSGTYSLFEANQVFDESTSYDYLGQTIDGADLDGDGDDELILSAPGNDTEAGGGGCIAIYNGSEELLNDSAYIWEFDDFDFYFSYDNASICSETGDARLGFNSGVVLGDFDGDGITDLAVAAPGTDPSDTPRVFVFFDAPSLMGQPHIAEQDADVIITGADGFFGYGLAAGDFNGDGADDLAIGSPYLSDPVNALFEPDALLYNGTANGNGMVHLYSGLTISGSGGALPSLTDADADATISSPAADMFGITLVASDMNGDGKEDLWVGAPMHDGDAGRASLYLMP